MNLSSAKIVAKLKSNVSILPVGRVSNSVGECMGNLHFIYSHLIVSKGVDL